MGNIIFLASYDRIQIEFKDLATNLMETLMMVSCMSLIVPTVVSSSLLQATHLNPHDESDILDLSQGTAICLLLLFIAYVHFLLTQNAYLSMADTGHFSDTNNSSTAAGAQRQRTIANILISSVLLLAAIAFTVAHAFHLVRSVGPLAQTLATSNAFISLVIIPFAGNSAKWIDLMRRSRNEDVTFPLRTIIGSTLQIALLALPLLTVLGWIFAVPIALNFDIFEVAVLFLSIMVMNSILQDTRATYFEGAMLMGS
jgi:Ca2+:H+ antiporter